MTTIAPAPDLADTSNDDDDDLHHYVCSCNPTRGMCGADVAGKRIMPLDEDIENDCIVCVHLAELPCLKCGAI